MDGVSALHCRTCGAKLTKEACFSRVLPLPSPFWHEMADMWICHDDFRCLSPIGKLGASDLRARRGHCLHGEHELLVHADDLVPGSIEWGAARPDSLWGMVRCSRCQGPLGVALIGDEKKTPMEKRPRQEGGFAARTAAPPKARGKAHTKRSMLASSAPMHAATSQWLADTPSSVVPGADLLTADGAAAREPEPLKVVLPDGSSMPWKDLADAMDDTQGAAEQQQHEDSLTHIPSLPNSDVKVFKYWASSCSDPGSAQDALAAHTLLRRCTHDMLQISGAHANFKFLLRASDAGLAPQVLVSLMGWGGSVCGSDLSMIDDSSVRQAALPSAGTPGEAVFDKQIRVATCMYAICADNEELSCALLNRWREGSPNNVDHIDMLEEECEAIARALRCSTMLLPPSQRLINGLAMGFLPV
jgi:hypothetical protein